MADEQQADAGMIARSQLIARRKAQGRRTPMPRVRVLPRDDTIRANIVHWPTRIAFPAEGSVEWPNDRFTQRRIADGDVTVEGTEEAKNQSGPQRNRRSQEQPPKEG